jgi:hypothetical protein
MRFSVGPSYFKFSSQTFTIENGVCFEEPRFYDSEQTKYTSDNISYTLKSSFTFDYYYLSEQNEKYKFLFRRDPNKRGNE